ncbi:C-C motif chemokine 3-like [Alligator sinensis]|uniref:C-C motif chemokine n=1 Tax=Alligator sinensis TaxID=38654 RepID=A0A1U7SBU1_ALLSI|nr:C-C motif chemokine 3-like [Alligator sinensis]
MKVTVAALATLLLAACCSQIQAQLDGVTTPTSCCFTYTKKIPRALVASYKATSSKCSQPAVIFTTKKGREVCADPNEKWVQDYMKHLERN